MCMWYKQYISTVYEQKQWCIPKYVCIYTHVLFAFYFQSLCDTSIKLQYTTKLCILTYQFSSQKRYQHPSFKWRTSLSALKPARKWRLYLNPHGWCFFFQAFKNVVSDVQWWHDHLFVSQIPRIHFECLDSLEMRCFGRRGAPGCRDFGESEDMIGNNQPNNQFADLNPIRKNGVYHSFNIFSGYCKKILKKHTHIFYKPTVGPIGSSFNCTLYPPEN